MVLLRDQMRWNLVEPLADCMRRYFPGQCRILGDAQLRQCVALGLENAAAHELFAEREVFLYLSLMFMFGSFFDSDPQFRWRLLLTRDTLPGSYARIRATYDAAMDYLDQTVGAKEEQNFRILLRIRRFDPHGAMPGPAADFTLTMREVLQSLHPGKAREMGEEAAGRLIASGTERAAHYGITEPKGRMIYLLHMFLLGSDFDRDPLFPWAAAALNDASLPGSGEKAERLYRGAMEHLNRSLEAVGR